MRLKFFQRTVHLSHVDCPVLTIGSEWPQRTKCGRMAKPKFVCFSEAEATCEHCLAIARAEKARKAAIKHTLDCGDYALRDPEFLKVMAEAKRTYRKHYHVGH
jgi:hypothetical protein